MSNPHMPIKPLSDRDRLPLRITTTSLQGWSQTMLTVFGCSCYAVIVFLLAALLPNNQQIS